MTMNWLGYADKLAMCVAVLASSLWLGFVLFALVARLSGS